MYARYLKHIFDFILSLIAIIFLSPIILFFVVIGAFAMKGNPFIMQLRPGKIDKKTGTERIFKLIKLRTMTCEKDADGNLLPDEKRLTKYGQWLRSTSLDELPELFNILKGDMSIVGPRPQLVRDMVFMTSEQRKRHSVRQGLTGLAQVNGRNNMAWEDKFSYDLQYIEKITLFEDIKIIFMTVIKVFKRDGITEEGNATAEDYGDCLLRLGKISREEYIAKQEEAKSLMRV